MMHVTNNYRQPSIFNFKLTWVQLVVALNLVLIMPLTASQAYCQSLLDSIVQNDDISTEAMATFKANRLILGPTTENIAKGELNFAVLHNFGTFSSGFSEFFGLDNANTSLNFDYGLINNVNLGLARSTYQKTFEGYSKWRLLAQHQRVPLTASLYTAVYVNGTPFAPDNQVYQWQHRLSYLVQLLLARKFSSSLSAQVSPFYLHQNLVKLAADHNTIWGMFGGARYKLTNRLTVVAEFSWIPPSLMPQGVVNYFGTGLEMDTGGHVFQLRVSNTSGLFLPQIAAQTQNKWANGDIGFGFTINRRFNLH
jgi:hypothetical protein